MAFTTQGLIFSQYSDIFCGVLILFFCEILFNLDFEIKDYWKRLLLLLLLSTSLYLTKSIYIVLTGYLLAFWLFFDAKYIFTNLKRLIGSYQLWLAIILYLLFCIPVYRYSLNFKGSDSFILQTLREIFFLDKARISYMFSLFDFLISEIPMLIISQSVVWALLFDKGLMRKNLVNLLFVLGLIAAPLGFYFIKMWSFEDMSLLRYLFLTVFAASSIAIIVFQSLDFNPRTSKSAIIPAILIILIPISILGKTVEETGQDLEFNPTTGRYRDFIWQKDFYMLAELVKQETDSGSRILIVDQEGELLGNMGMPVIFLRYYLSNYSVGGQYRYPPEEWFKYMVDVSPDYILVFSYDDYWLGCNDILDTGHTYLISAGNLNNEYSEKECFFSAEDIIEL
jgi:hypothetical protein